MASRATLGPSSRVGNSRGIRPASKGKARHTLSPHSAQLNGVACEPHISREELKPAQKPKTDNVVVQKIKDVFRVFDTDGSGRITKHELWQVLKRLSPDSNATERDVELCMVQADTNQNGFIEYEEFIDWLMKPGARISVSAEAKLSVCDFEAMLRPLFDVFDRDGGGSISYSEFEEVHTILKNALNLSPGTPTAAPNPTMLCDDLTAAQAFRQVDVNRDRSINFDEFVKWQKKVLSKSGLTNDDLKELVPALARQLRRVFKMADAAEKGDIELDRDVATNTLERVIANISKYSRDIWNESGIGHSSIRGKHHYTNRWSEPPVGLNIERLKRKHLCSVQHPILGIESWDIEVLCVPEVDADPLQVSAAEAGSNGTERRWLAAVDSQISYKGLPKGARKEIVYPQRHYVYQDLSWEYCEADGKETFETAVRCLPPELRMFCLLKTEANFGVTISGSSIQAALKSAVGRGFLTQAQHQQYIGHIEAQVRNTMRMDHLDDDLDEHSRDAMLQRLCADICVAPRNVMAVLSDLGIYKASSVWADF